MPPQVLGEPAKCATSGRSAVILSLDQALREPTGTGHKLHMVYGPDPADLQSRDTWLAGPMTAALPTASVPDAVNIGCCPDLEITWRLLTALGSQPMHFLCVLFSNKYLRSAAMKSYAMQSWLVPVLGAILLFGACSTSV